MRRSTTTAAATSFAAASAAGLLLLGGVFGSGAETSVAATPSKVGNECAKTVKFTAYDAPRGSHNFGPTQDDHTLKVMASRLGSKNCSDPLFAATFVNFVDDGATLSSSDAEAQAQTFQKDRKAWTKAIDEASGKVDHYEMQQISQEFDTLGMVPGASRSTMPRLVKQSARKPVGWALVAHMKDGTVRVFRVVCDLQPSVLKFPNVPVKPPVVKPPTKTNKPPTSPPSTPPSSPPTAPPTTKKVCKWPTPYGKWPVCKDTAARDVLRNPAVTAQVKGTGAGGTRNNPVDSPTGCQGACATTTGTPAPAATTEPAQVSSPQPAFSTPITATQTGDPTSVCKPDNMGIPSC